MFSVLILLFHILSFLWVIYFLFTTTPLHRILWSIRFDCILICLICLSCTLCYYILWGRISSFLADFFSFIFSITSIPISKTCEKKLLNYNNLNTWLCQSDTMFMLKDMERRKWYWQITVFMEIILVFAKVQNHPTRHRTCQPIRICSASRVLLEHLSKCENKQST